MMRFIHRLILSALLAVTFVAPARAQDAGKTRTISLWQCFRVEETQVFREIMDQFAADYEKKTGTRLVIKMQYVSFDDMFAKLRTAALADLAPDVAFIDSIKVTDLAFGKALTAMDDLPAFKEKYGTREDAAPQFVPAAYNAGIVERLGVKKLYALPVQTTTIALFWNKDMFRAKESELRAAGLDPTRAPRDWDELYEYGKILTNKERGVHAFAFSSSLWFTFGIFNMYNVNFIEYDAQGRARPSIANKNGIAAATRLQWIANSGIEGGGWQRGSLGPDPMFLNRKVAMILTGPWNTENFANAGMNFDVALVPAPTRKEIEELGLQPLDPEEDPSTPAAYSSSNVGGQSGIIMRTCKDPDLAFEMIDYFTSEAVQRRWASQLGQIPVRRSAWKDLDTTKYPFMKAFMRQLAKSKRIPQVPLYTNLENDVYNPQVDLLLNKKVTPAEAVKRMEDVMNRAIISKINIPPDEK
ncbi:extracellular solute-binding protein [Candidatus Sumerlaeota bacterium]|nr:extracellular solute-binding protein [Candidatus Sumerlaeota bacterium]